MSNEEQAILPQDSQSESMPIAGASLLSRESYLDDDFKDDSKDNKTIWERCCGPIRAGSLRGAVLSLASIVFGICGFTFPIGLTNLGLIPSFILLVVLCGICYWSLSALLFAARKKKILKYGPLIKDKRVCQKAKKYAEGYLLKNLSSLNFSWPSGRRWSRPIPMKTPPEKALANPRNFVLVRQAFLL